MDDYEDDDCIGGRDDEDDYDSEDEVVQTAREEERRAKLLSQYKLTPAKRRTFDRLLSDTEQVPQEIHDLMARAEPQQLVALLMLSGLYATLSTYASGIEVALTCYVDGIGLSVCESNETSNEIEQNAKLLMFVRALRRWSLKRLERELFKRRTHLEMLALLAGVVKLTDETDHPLEEAP